MGSDSPVVSLVGFRARRHPQQVPHIGERLFPVDEVDPDVSVDDRGTDPILFDSLERYYHFTVDVAAAAHNAKCERYYTAEQNGLRQNWSGERVWCNPPYSNIAPWVRKAWDQWQNGPRPELIVMLLPANRTEQPWWQGEVEELRDRPDSPLHVRFLAGRPRFVAPTAVSPIANERPPFGCCLLIWSDG